MFAGCVLSQQVSAKKSRIIKNRCLVQASVSGFRGVPIDCVMVLFYHQYDFKVLLPLSPETQHNGWPVVNMWVHLLSCGVWPLTESCHNHLSFIMFFHLPLSLLMLSLKATILCTFVSHHSGSPVLPLLILICPNSFCQVFYSVSGLLLEVLCSPVSGFVNEYHILPFHQCISTKATQELLASYLPQTSFQLVSYSSYLCRIVQE